MIYSGGESIQETLVENVILEDGSAKLWGRLCKETQKNRMRKRDTTNAVPLHTLATAQSIRSNHDYASMVEVFQQNS